jgi:hypothetical protein
MPEGIRTSPTMAGNTTSDSSYIKHGGPPNYAAIGKMQFCIDKPDCRNITLRGYRQTN